MVLLKDVFDYSLEDISDLVESTTGGVKAALSRGRGKPATLTDARSPERKASEAELALLRLYVDRFNRRDWQGVRELASAHARLAVADCFAGRLADSPYFVEYERPICLLAHGVRRGGWRNRRRYSARRPGGRGSVLRHSRRRQ